MIEVCVENNFASWRVAARQLLRGRVPPEDVIWCPPGRRSLFDGPQEPIDDAAATNVPAEFVKIAEAVACFDSEEKWPLLYRLLFRLTSEGRDLLEIESDPDVLRARLMEKAVNKDVHKFHAFVRFRQTAVDDRELFLAWHEPHHFTVERAAPFFERRFGEMRFSIFTPKGCVHWDLQHLSFSPGVDSISQIDDEAERFWLTYYRSIYNPFRLKVGAMKKEMPKRHWRTLPEAALIHELLRKTDGSAASTPAAEPKPTDGDGDDPAKDIKS